MAGSIEAGRAHVLLTLRDLVKTGLARSQRTLNQFATRAAQVGAAAVGAATAAAGPAALGVRAFAGFDDKMRAVAAVTQATRVEMEKMTATAKRLGATTSFTAAEVADAMTNLGRLGFNPREINAAIGGVLDLSRATGTDLAQSTQIAGDIMRSFRIGTEQTGRVMDVLTATANGSSQTLVDVFESMKLLGPITAEAGDSFESTAAAIAMLANNGIKGSLAGNALARAYKNLAGERFQEKLLELSGVAATDAAGNLRPMAEILRDVGAAAASMPEAERLNLFEQIFGRGSIAAATLGNASANLDAFTSKLENSAGVAANTAATMEAGLGGSFRILSSSIEAVSLAIGEALGGALQSLADQASTALATLAEWIGANYDLVIIAGAVAAALGSTGVALIGVATIAKVASIAVGAITTIWGVLTGIVTTGSAVMTAAVSLLTGAFTLLLTPVGLLQIGLFAIGAAIVAMSGVWTSAVSSFGEHAGEMQRVAVDAFGSIREAIQAGDFATAARIAWVALKIEFLRGRDVVLTVWDTFVGALQNTWTNVVATLAGAFIRLYAFFANRIQAVIDRVNEIRTAVGLWEFEINVGIDEKGALEALEQSRDAEVDQRLQRSAQRASERDRDIGAAESELAALRKQAAESAQVAAARAAAQAQPNPFAEQERMEAEEQARLAAQRLEAAQQAAAQARAAQKQNQTGIVGSVGTFNAQAAGRINSQAITYAQRTANGIDELNENMETLIDEVALSFD